MLPNANRELPGLPLFRLGLVGTGRLDRQRTRGRTHQQIGHCRMATLYPNGHIRVDMQVKARTSADVDETLE